MLRHYRQSVYNFIYTRFYFYGCAFHRPPALKLPSGVCQGRSVSAASLMPAAHHGAPGVTIYYVFATGADVNYSPRRAAESEWLAPRGVGAPRHTGSGP